MSDVERTGRLAILALTACLLAAGCASLPGLAPASSSLKARQAATSFSVSGRIAARDIGDTKRGFSGSFSWDHKSDRDVVELLTPLGQIAARLTLTVAGADIELADGQHTTTRDPEQFLMRVLGIGMPIAALPYWMQAVAVPSATVRAEADAIGRPAALWQNGWQIRYTEYADAGVDAYPTRIELSQGDIEARMIIADWKTP